MTEKFSICQPSDYAVVAAKQLDVATYAYIAGGSGDEKTLQANRKAFDAVQLKQKAFADFSQATTQTALLGETFRHPILLAPVAAQNLVNPDGEVATAQAASALDAGMILSTRTSQPMRAVASATQAHKWFQLYFQPDRAVTLDLVRQAEGAGFQAIVVTLDTPIQSVSKRAQLANFKLPAIAQPVHLSHVPNNEVSLAPHESIIFQGLMRSAPQLKDIEWLVKQTNLPVLVKGVMDTDEITQLRSIGIQGLVISNHGGRALDSVPDSLSLLTNIRAHVGKDFLLLLDSGIQSGYDVFKGLALGADAVCIGRLQMYALAVNGAKGVAHLLKLLRDELELCMALTGCPTIADINPACLFSIGEIDD